MVFLMFWSWIVCGSENETTMEYLFSGGVDTQVCWSNVKTFANQKAKCTYKKSNAGGVNQVQKVKGSMTIFIFFKDQIFAQDNFYFFRIKFLGWNHWYLHFCYISDQWYIIILCELFVFDRVRSRACLLLLTSASVPASGCC